MDSIISIFSSISLDTIISDPMLLIGSILFVIGISVFFLSFLKLITFKNPNNFVVPHEEPPAPIIEEEPAVVEIPTPRVESRPVAHRIASAPSADQTMIMPAGVADVQAQVEIAITQIRQLNKKVIDIEENMEAVAKHAEVRLELNELKESPMNPTDFTQKLLKLAEHVIILEKEMAKMKNQLGQSTPTPPTKPNNTAPTSVQVRPPIMPL